MILECKSCQKKFIVPDSAITSTGRLVQCSSCGNKWTQYPVQKLIKKPLKENKPKSIEKKFPISQVKKKKSKKKIGPSIYSAEYLKKKHGITIDESKSKNYEVKNKKSPSTSYFGFYSYLFIFLFTITFFIGILNLTKEIVIYNFPFTEIYIEYLFENLNNFGILFRDTFNLY